MGGRKLIGFGALMVAAGIGLGFVIGRVTGHATPAPSLATMADHSDDSAHRFSGALTDTTAPTAPAAESVPAPPSNEAPPAILAESRLPVAAPKPAPAAVRAQADAGAPVAPPPAPPAPDETPAPATPAPAPPMTPTEYALSVRRTADQLAVTHSSFDEGDVTEHHPVSDHPVTGSDFDQQDRTGAGQDLTRSSFDDEDNVDQHPTGP